MDTVWTDCTYKVLHKYKCVQHFLSPLILPYKLGLFHL